MQVWAKNEELGKLLKHPMTKVGFIGNEPANWPDDAFTQRRIRDGDVFTEAPSKEYKEQVSERRTPVAAEPARAMPRPPGSQPNAAAPAPGRGPLMPGRVDPAKAVPDAPTPDVKPPKSSI